MHPFYIILLSFLIVSCQPSKPSDLEQYHALKLIDNQQLETQFSQKITTSRTAIKEAPLDTKNFIASTQTINELKKTLAALQNANDASKSNGKIVDIASITPSTSTEEIRRLDSTANTQTADIVQSSSKTSNGGLLLNVRDYQETYNKIQKLSAKYNFNIANENEETTDFHKANTLEIYVAPENFEAVVSDLRNLALVIRQKYIWQQEDNQHFLTLQSQIAATGNFIQQIKNQLATTTSLDDKLRIQHDLTENIKALDLLVLNATTAISNKPYSCLMVGFYQNLDFNKPVAPAFSADFSNNLVVGWVNFKQFVLDAALVWPYIILGLILIIIIAVAIGNNRRKERQFKLQMMQATLPKK